MRRHTAIPPATSGFPIIPMIDIMLLLLLFYMLINRYLPPTLNVTLPEASSAVAQQSQAIEISIDAGGRLLVNGAVTAWEGLPAMLAGRDPATVVRIAADKTADYDYVVRALDAAGQAGLPHIALEIKPVPPRAPAG